MRDLLTALAVLVLMLLAGLWIGPAFVDWQPYRSTIDALLTRSLGVETRSQGDVRLTLLPTPRLRLAQVTVGGGTRAGLSAETLDAELALTPLLRGEWHFRVLRLDGVEARLDLDSAGTLPALTTGISASPSVAFDRIEVLRGRLALSRAGSPLLRLGPVALEASAPTRRGPWRLAGEIGGYSLRLATGETGNDGMRLRLTLTGAEGPALDSDGQFSLHEGKPNFTGTWQLRPPGDATAAGQVSGRVTLDPDRLTLPEIALEWGPAAGLAATNRMTGAFSLPFAGNDPGLLRLAARRLDLGPLAAPVAPPFLAWQGWPFPGRSVRLALEAEQVVISGEEIARVALAGILTDRRLSLDTATGRFAGLDWRAEGEAGAERVSLDLTLASAETGRLALALARLGLDAPLADLVGAQGQLEANGRLLIAAEGLKLENWRGSSGGASWSLDAGHGPSGVTLRLDADSVRLDGVPALAGAGGLDGSASLNLTRARIGATTGDIRARIERQGPVLKLAALSARGFGGLVLEGTGETGVPGSRLALKLDAPQALPALTLLAPLLPEVLATRLRGQAEALSPVSLTGTLTRQESGLALAAEGRAGSMRLDLASALAPHGKARTASLRLRNASTDQIARLAGWPQPERATTDATLEFDLTDDAFAIRLAAPEVLLEGTGRRIPDLALDLTARSAAERLLPAPFPALLDRDRLLDGRARLRLDADGSWQIGNLTGRDGRESNAGRLTYAANGHLQGEIDLPRLQASALLASGLQTREIIDESGRWSTRRFAPAAFAFTADFGLRASALGLTPGLDTGPVTMRLRLTPDEMQISDLRTSLAGSPVTATGRMARSGGLGSIGVELALQDAAAARLARGFSGTYGLNLTLGGSGETPAQIVASLGGQGTLRLNNLAIVGLDPAALASIVADTRDELLDRTQMDTALGRALARAPLTVPVLAVPLAVTAGTIRAVAPPVMAGGTRIEASGQIDLRQLTLDTRLRMALAERPRGWIGELPQLALRWSGPIAAPQRQLDAGQIVNGLAQRRLQQEMDRLDAFNADLRERSFFARRLRAERDLATRPPPDVPLPDTSAPEAALPPLPPPVQISPVPAPLSRPPDRR